MSLFRKVLIIILFVVFMIFGASLLLGFVDIGLSNLIKGLLEKGN